MNASDAQDSKVTDADIEAIVEQGEAGIGDLLAAYEPVERDYFNAVQSSTVVVTSSSNSTPR